MIWNIRRENKGEANCENNNNIKQLQLQNLDNNIIDIKQGETKKQLHQIDYNELSTTTATKHWQHRKHHWCQVKIKKNYDNNKTATTTTISSNNRLQRKHYWYQARWKIYDIKDNSNNNNNSNNSNKNNNTITRTGKLTLVD